MQFNCQMLSFYKTCLYSFTTLKLQKEKTLKMSTGKLLEDVEQLCKSATNLSGTILIQKKCICCITFCSENKNF
ncbi:hypothetical protein OIU79_011762 [Salix purpurea]|uniref:Uncharacterized protein n=1 Tax=Salix purpurea TaxID=77065 RepID=A0A9Q0T2I8_SALPP|nr:hypothetical protein OIU79_011762 [Salix purpurea]